jgi:hypothetical protein
MPIQQGPTPWWQLPEYASAFKGLGAAAPPGQTFNPTTGGYQPIVGSPQNTLELQQRQLRQEDEDRFRAASAATGQDNRMRQALAEQQMALQHLMAQQQSDAFNANERAKGREAREDVNRTQTQGFLQDFIRRTEEADQRGTTGGTAPTVPSPMAQTGAISTAADAAHQAAFGQAKAQAGSLARSSLQGLRGELSERGILGSGVEGRGIADRLAMATNPLSDANTAALRENVGITQHNQDLASNAANIGFQGAITQRGQDLEAQNAARNRRTASITQALGGLQRLY